MSRTEFHALNGGDQSLSDAEIAAFISEQRPGWSLAQPFYNDPAIFEREVERIFSRQWFLVDHASRIPKRGDYFLFELAGESIIVVRGKDQRVRAFFNVCLHRGSRVCLESAGTKQVLVCPYHAWSYGLDGRLIAAHAMPEDFDKSQFGLRECSVHVVENLIFVCLSDEPPDREPSFKLLEKYFRPHGIAQAKVAHRVTWRLAANWKLAIENFRECYHCGPAHPEYCSVVPAASLRTAGVAHQMDAFDALQRSWEERVRAMGLISESSHPAYAWRKGEQEPPCRVSRQPLKEGFSTQSREGQPVAPLMGDYTSYDGGMTGACFNPTSFINASSDYALIPRYLPNSVAETAVEFIWLVRGGAVEGVDYHIEDLIWLWKVTTDQDVKIVEDNQKGVNSRAYRPGPYSSLEDGVARFISDYLGQIS